MRFNHDTKAIFLLLAIHVHLIHADSQITYFDGKGDRTMSVVSSTFAPTHPDVCCVKKALPEPIATESKEIASPPLPVPVIQKEGDSDGDGVVDSKDGCPNTPKGYKADEKGCPRSVTLHLNFASNSSTLPASADNDINSLTAFMQENPAAISTIVGHTDSTGSTVKNQVLSENRAASLASRLIQNGIASDRITAVGKGSDIPVVSNKTPEGRAQNRRIEILIR